MSRLYPRCGCGVRKTQTFTNNTRISNIPTVITYSSPFSIVIDFYPSIIIARTVNKTDILCNYLRTKNHIILENSNRKILDTKLWITYKISKVFIPGHIWMLQLSWIEAGPLHSSPPYAAKTFSVLVLVLVPSPHVAEHVPIVQSFHWQSTALQLRWKQK